MTPATRFIITGQGRCGSSLLKSSLETHPQIQVADEYFNTRVYPEAKNQVGNTRARDFFDSADPTARAVGFKICPNHARKKPEVRVWRFLSTKKISVVHLVRQNTLERLISLKIATESEVWRANQAGEERRDLITFNLPPEQWLAEIEEDTAAEERLADLFKNNNYLRVTYEALISNWDDEVARVEDFLGVDRMQLAKMLARQEKQTKGQRLENHAELLDFFQGTEYRWMFD